MSHITPVTTKARTFRLDALARAAGVSPRTVRYYIQRGLVPPPIFRGPDTSYDARHLLALRVIRRLSDQHLPLDAIARELAARSEADLEHIAEGTITVGLTDTSPAAEREAPTLAARLERGERWLVADGLEIWIADDTDAEVRQLARDLVDYAHTWGAKK